MLARAMLAMVLAAAVISGLVACEAASPAPDAQSVLLPELGHAQDDPMVPVVRGRVENRLILPGLIEAHGHEVLSFEVPGIVAMVRGQRGMAVQAGSVLASLDSEALNAQIGTERATLGQVLKDLAVVEARFTDERATVVRAVLAAAAELAARTHGLEVVAARPPKNEVRVAEARVGVAIGVVADRTLDLVVAESTVDAVIAAARSLHILRGLERTQAQDELDALPADTTALERATLERRVAEASRQLAEAWADEQQAVSPEGPPHVRVARRDLVIAKTDLLSAQSDLAQLVAEPMGTELAAANAALESAQFEHDSALEKLADLDSGTSTIGSDIARLRAEVRRIEGRVTTLADRMTKLDVIAPFDGVVARALTVRGREVAEGEPVLELAPAGDLVFEAVASPAQADNLEVGQSVQVILRAFPDERIDGTVVTLPVQIGNPSDTPFIQLTVDWADKAVTIGMQGMITVLLDAADRVLKVPATAVWTVNGRSFVEMLIDDRRRSRHVTIGMQNDEEIEILTGLSEGDMVFVTVRS